MAENPRISFFYTKKEWKIIDKKIRASGKRDFNAFVRGNVHNLKDLTKECPGCIEELGAEKIRKTCSIPTELHATILKIAFKMNLDPGALISKLLIDPLLFTKKGAE